MSEAPTPPVEMPAPALGPEGGSPLGVSAAASEGGETQAASEGDPTLEGGTGNDKVETPTGEESASAPLSAESYEFTLPEGVTADDATMTTFKETLAEAGVSPENGTKLFDLYVGEVKKGAEAWAKAQSDAWTETTNAWKAELEADPDYGGEKAKAVQTSIGRALDEYGTPEARQAFDLTGAGWNPHIVKFVHRMAAALQEGSSLPATGPASNRSRTMGETLYPDSPQP